MSAFERALNAVREYLDSLRHSALPAWLEERLQELSTRLESLHNVAMASARELDRQALTAQMPCLVWTVDRALRIQDAIGGLKRYPHLYQGHTLYQIFARYEPDFPPIAAHLKALRGESARFEHCFKDRYFEARVEPLRDGADHIIGGIGVAIDSTERNQAEEQLHRLHSELAAIDRLGALASLASAIAHEVNQPLTAIVTYTQACLRLLKAEPGQRPDLIKAMEQVAAQGQRAGEIIRQAREFTRPRTYRRSPVDLAALIGETAAFANWRASRHQVQIQLKLAQPLPLIAVDPVQIQQVLLNLLSNAIEALSRWPGRRRITLTAQPAPDGMVEVAVSDTGPGLSSDVAAQLFNPFFTTKANSAGVGLALCRSIIEAHRGRLWTTPNRPAGVTFHFTVPIAKLNATLSASG